MRVDRFGVDPDPVAQLGTARAIGATVLCPGDPEWPARVDDHPLPPVCLWVLGDPDLAALAERSVSVVGARSSTSYGDAVATGFGSGLAERGWTVVSGAAFGIDAAAHRGALSVDGATVAVLAGGVDRPYPLAHATLLQRIAEGGAVVAEVAPGMAPTRPRFLLRNRIIASISRGVVVVEAALRSGSLNTARTAAEIGRPVGVVPGPVTSMMSSGCHQARRDGLAEIVTDVDEVIDLVGDLGVDAAPRRSAEPDLTDLLDPTDALVLAAVPVRRSLSATGHRGGGRGPGRRLGRGPGAPGAPGLRPPRRRGVAQGGDAAALTAPFLNTRSRGARTRSLSTRRRFVTVTG